MPVKVLVADTDFMRKAILCFFERFAGNYGHRRSRDFA
jgi:hypothetical protein